LQGKYKDQTEATSLTTDSVKPTSLMKGMAMNGPHTNSHHRITGGLTKMLNSELGAQTGPTKLSAHHCTCSKIHHHHLPLTYLQ
jgi:hypothetical protein